MPVTNVVNILRSQIRGLGRVAVLLFLVVLVLEEHLLPECCNDANDHCAEREAVTPMVFGGVTVDLSADDGEALAKDVDES